MRWHLCAVSYEGFLYLFLLQEKAEISEKENAKPLQLNGGSIQFDNVHFRWEINFMQDALVE